MLSPKFGSFAAAKVAVAILICLGACLQAHERPTPAQLAEARRRGDLKERLDFMRALGTDRMSPELEQRAKAKIEAAVSLVEIKMQNALAAVTLQFNQQLAGAIQQINILSDDIKGLKTNHKTEIDTRETQIQLLKTENQKLKNDQ